MGLLQFKREFPFIGACPAILWQVFFLAVPVTILLSISFYNPDTGKLTLEYYQGLWKYPYLRSIANSCLLSFATVLCCLAIAIPTAYFIAFRIVRHKTLLLVLLMLPSWTNFIVRIYAWFFLLEKDGFLSVAARHLGLLDGQAHLLGNLFAVLIGMVYCYFPFMVIPIYSAFDGINKNLLEAAADLGASRFHILRSIVFPLALPGVFIGSALVFLSALGEFAVQEILGGSKHSYWGSVVADQFLTFRDFRSGAALTFDGVLCGIFVIACIYFFIRGLQFVFYLRRSRLFRRKSSIR